MDPMAFERVPIERMVPFWESRAEEGKQIGERLEGAEVPILLAQHKGCLLYTDEGFEDAVAALRGASVVRTDNKPSTSPEFARTLEAFCREHVPISS